LSDPFYLEGTQRISVRDKIFREIASNSLIHREYLNAFPAKVIIESNRIYTENSNKPHTMGLIDPDNFTPYPKNPVIARVFKEIGLADELGSGVRNLMKFVQIYSQAKPELMEGDVFKIVIPLSDQATGKVTDQVTVQVTPQVTGEVKEFTPQATREVTQQVTDQATVQVTPQATGEGNRIQHLLVFCRSPRTRAEIQEFLQLKDREYVRIHVLKPLIENGLLTSTTPDRPNNPRQKYYSQDTPPATGEVIDQDERIRQLIDFCRVARSASEIMEHLGLTHKEYVRVEVLQPLIQKGILLLTIPDKPNSPKQKYIATSAGANHAETL
jgi:ATP-dependent DNA helicase RecG